MTPAQYERIFELRTDFRPDGDDLQSELSMNDTIYGGLINSPEAAVKYAHVLMQSKPSLATIPEAAMKAEERAGVWHITIKSNNGQTGGEVLSFSRLSGKLVSGSL